ncbi:L,D-transpeptidase [Rhizobium sp. LjRoot254]|uniref:L,D-transpeptidase n=1 Tax=Rhizobium sp. LjRoot254 TaxID=3342297 RepID=UPI003ECC60CC
MIRKTLLLASAFALFAVSVQAEERYKVIRPVIIESGIAGEWMTQLSGPVRARVLRKVERRQVQYRTVRRAGLFSRPVVQQVTYRAEKPPLEQMEPQFLPQVVAYETKYKPGTIIIDTNNRFLYLVLADGKARRYGVGVGKPGFEWAGEHRITRKAEWPEWNPPKEMITREAAKGHILPAHMEGSEANPLGARALYLGSTLYRIHGTNAPWTIGYAVSSGCIRMRNQDVVDLYERVKVGTRVIVI